MQFEFTTSLPADDLHKMINNYAEQLKDLGEDMWKHVATRSCIPGRGRDKTRGHATLLCGEDSYCFMADRADAEINSRTELDEFFQEQIKSSAYHAVLR